MDVDAVFGYDVTVASWHLDKTSAGKRLQLQRHRLCAYLRHVCACLRTEGDHHRQKHVLRQASLQVLLDIHSLAGAGGPNQQAMVVVTYQRIQQVGVAQGISCIRNAQKRYVKLANHWLEHQSDQLWEQQHRCVLMPDVNSSA